MSKNLSRRDFLKLGILSLFFPAAEKAERFFGPAQEILHITEASLSAIPNKASWVFDIPQAPHGNKILVYKAPIQIASVSSSMGQSSSGTATATKEKIFGVWAEVRDVPLNGVHRVTSLDLNWSAAELLNSYTEQSQVELENVNNGTTNQPGEAYVFALTSSSQNFGWQMFLTPNFTLHGQTENRGGDVGYSTKINLFY